MLYRRLTRAAGGDIVATGAERVLGECFHATTESVAVRADADTLVEAAHRLGIEVDPVSLGDLEVDDTPLSDASDPRMTDRDYATLVERYLGAGGGSIDSGELAHCLKAYASADLHLLRELVAHGAMDRLGCPRLSGRRLEP
jgi:hypothetical protein